MLHACRIRSDQSASAFKSQIPPCKPPFCLASASASALRVLSPSEPGCTIAIGVGNAFHVGPTDSIPSYTNCPTGVRVYAPKGYDSSGNHSCSDPQYVSLLKRWYQSLSRMLLLTAWRSPLTPSSASATL